MSGVDVLAVMDVAALSQTISEDRKDMAEARAAVAELLSSLDLIATWLEAALKCQSFAWDADQHEAATDSLAEARAAIAKATGGDL